MNVKVRAQAMKMANFDAAVETTLAETRRDLDGEIASFRNAKTAFRTYLQGQVRTRRLMHFGNYKNIALTSQYRSNSKHYKIRITPNPMPGIKITTDMQITYLTKLLYVMIEEDLARPLERTALPENIQLVRKLPVISQLFLNPESRRHALRQWPPLSTTRCTPVSWTNTLGRFSMMEVSSAYSPYSSFPTKVKPYDPSPSPISHPSPAPYPHPFPYPHPHPYHKPHTT